jgi:hypothetical protein
VVLGATSQAEGTQGNQLPACVYYTRAAQESEAVRFTVIKPNSVRQLERCDR